MFEYIESLDQHLLLSINCLHQPWLDEVMWWISERITWIPLYLFLLYHLFRLKGLKIALLFTALVVLTIVIADTISVYALKETVQRYRPSHHSILGPQLHYYLKANGEYYTGGQYGFVSSHATNFFVIAGCFLFAFYKELKKTTYLLYGVALLVCFSRMYLGVHYPLDVIGGALLGTSVSYLTVRFIWKKLVLPKL